MPDRIRVGAFTREPASLSATFISWKLVASRRYGVTQGGAAAQHRRCSCVQQFVDSVGRGTSAFDWRGHRFLSNDGPEVGYPLSLPRWWR
jgi:hypothetical protein